MGKRMVQFCDVCKEDKVEIFRIAIVDEISEQPFYRGEVCGACHATLVAEMTELISELTEGLLCRRRR